MAFSPGLVSRLPGQAHIRMGVKEERDKELVYLNV
jgi:hypothetical protein